MPALTMPMGGSGMAAVPLQIDKLGQESDYVFPAGEAPLGIGLDMAHDAIPGSRGGRVRAGRLFVDKAQDERDRMGLRLHGRLPGESGDGRSAWGYCIRPGSQRGYRAVTGWGKGSIPFQEEWAPDRRWRRKPSG